MYSNVISVILDNYKSFLSTTAYQDKYNKINIAQFEFESGTSDFICYDIRKDKIYVFTRNKKCSMFISLIFTVHKSLWLSSIAMLISLLPISADVSIQPINELN